MALPKLLVELGVFESCGVIFLQLHHSKEISDRYFGLIQRMLRRAIIFGLETMGRAVDSLFASVEAGTQLKLIKLNPMAHSAFKVALAERFPSLTAECAAPPGLLFGEMHYHYFFAVRTIDVKMDLARVEPVVVFAGEPPVRLSDVLGPLLPDLAVHIQMSHMHDSPRREHFLMRGGRPPPSEYSSLSPLYMRHTPVVAEKATKAAANVTAASARASGDGGA